MALHISPWARTGQFWLLIALLAAGEGCGASVAREPTGIAVQDVDGGEHRLFDGREDQAIVLVFWTQDCPIANAYAPEINRLAAEFMPRGIRWFVVQVDAGLTPEAARRHAHEYELQCPVILDGEQRLAREAGATRTPEVAVFSPRGDLLYRGRIDDRYVDFGKRRAEPTTHDLRESLEDILAGRAVARPRTEAIGCDIPKAKE
jgi:hypothetical protein